MFMINGVQYELTSDVLQLELSKEKDKNLCLFGISGSMPGAYGAMWTFGVPFYRQYCVIHDMERKRMGFAKPLKKLLRHF